MTRAFTRLVFFVSATEDSGHGVRNIMEPDAKNTFVRTFKLRADEVWLIMQTLDLSDSFALPSTQKTSNECLDSTDSIVELAEASRYHWILLDCGYGNDAKAITLDRLSAVLALIVRAYAPQELPDFPGN